MTTSTNGPSERELRLIGPISGKRVLDLGCGTGAAAIGFAKQGAVVIAVDSSRADLREARERAEAEEAKVEYREGDLADLAFLRADSIDVVFSGGTIGEVEDLARVFRQVQRVLRPHAAFVFSYDHPFGLSVGPDGTVEHSYFDPGPVTVERDGEPVQLFTRSISEIFTELGRAGFRVDTLVEPQPSRSDAMLPNTIIWRARKEGA